MLDLPQLQPRVDVAVFGGSGFYTLADHLEAVDIETPFGPPSAPAMIGEIGGRPVAFLARHSEGHSVPAHRVNYRANVWAMAALGTRALVAPSPAGPCGPSSHAATWWSSTAPSRARARSSTAPRSSTCRSPTPTTDTSAQSSPNTLAPWG